jgi:hypothetical protein
MPKRSPSKVDKQQRDRFIKAAREAGASEDEREFDESLRRIATAKSPEAKDKKKGKR